MGPAIRLVGTARSGSLCAELTEKLRLAERVVCSHQRPASEHCEHFQSGRPSHRGRRDDHLVSRIFITGSTDGLGRAAASPSRTDHVRAQHVVPLEPPVLVAQRGQQYLGLRAPLRRNGPGPVGIEELSHDLAAVRFDQ
jgi:hypothetical protein